MPLAYRTMRWSTGHVIALRPLADELSVPREGSFPTARTPRLVTDTILAHCLDAG